MTKESKEPIEEAQVEVQEVEVLDLPEFGAFSNKMKELGLGYIVVANKKPALDKVSDDYAENTFCMAKGGASNALILTAAAQTAREVKEHTGKNVDDTLMITRLWYNLDQVGVDQDTINDIISNL